MEALGTLVKRERLRRGMRGIDLAYAIGKDPGYVTKIEHGTLKEIPAPATVEALSRALGVPAAELVKAIGFPTAAAIAPTPTVTPATDDFIGSLSREQRRTLRAAIDRADAAERGASATADVAQSRPSRHVP